MKLELKHLVGYLPYGLRIKSKNSIIYEVEYASRTEIATNTSFQLLFHYDEIKPILRPISYLTKEIDGVVYFEIIKEAFPNVPNFYSLLRTKVLDSYSLSDTNVEYCIVDYLFQHHFDVYGLIENGLAIDVNTL